MKSSKMSELFDVPSGCNAKYTIFEILPFHSILLGRFLRGTVPAPWDIVSRDGIGIYLRFKELNAIESTESVEFVVKLFFSNFHFQNY